MEICQLPPITSRLTEQHSIRLIIRRRPIFIALFVKSRLILLFLTFWTVLRGDDDPRMERGSLGAFFPIEKKKTSHADKIISYPL